jgi:hypothetical protein
MLRMRPKPPAGLPSINSGQPWSDLDLADLREELHRRRSITEIAEFLCRDVDEVAAKAAELSRDDGTQSQA